MATKVNTWVLVVVGVVVVGILGLIALAAAGLYFFARNVETRVASPAAASQEFDAVRARFAEQKPLIELDDRGRFLRAHTDRPAHPDSPPPGQVHVLVFDPDDGRIVSMSVPFWLLRLQRRGSTAFSVDGQRMDLEDLGITVEDLERYGPTLILDHATPSGERVLVWSQ